MTLTANLKADLDPIQFSALEEFRRFEGFEEVFFILLRMWSRVKLIEDPTLEQFLI
jgi:hypothetical protein